MRTLLLSLFVLISTASLSQEVPADSIAIPDKKDTYISADAISAIIVPFVREKAMIMLDDKEVTFKQFKSLNPQEYKSLVILTKEVALEKFGKKGKNGVIELTSKPTGKNLPITDEKEDKLILPEFPGGETALRNYIASHMRYPREALNWGIQGKVIVSFVISSTGKVGQAMIVRGVHLLLDTEAIRVVSQMPDWKPGILKGKAVNVRHTIPLEFILQ